MKFSQLAQVTEYVYNAQRAVVLRRLNEATRCAVDHHHGIDILRIGRFFLRVVGFSDASFATNYDLTTQLGHIVFLVDKRNAAEPFSFKSYKARRVVRSAMSGEVIAFNDMFDIAIALSEELQIIVGYPLPVQLLTDSKSLFDIISKGSRTSKKQTMLDIAAAREGFRDHVISDTGFVRTKKNVADGLTKPMSQALLRNIIASATLDISPNQWIIRSEEIT